MQIIFDIFIEKFWPPKSPKTLDTIGKTRTPYRATRRQPSRTPWMPL